MVVPVVDMTYNGKPVEVLMQLIDKRRKILGELGRDAVIATAITVLKSLRAQTKRFKGKLKIKHGRGRRR
jgi:hypothetical protein